MNKFIYILLLILINLSVNSAIADEENNQKLLVVRPGILDLGEITYGAFLECLKTASFPLDTGPREILITPIPPTVSTIINKTPFVFHIMEDEASVIVNSITAGTKTSSNVGEKIQTIAFIFNFCQ